jgi:histidinol phosphatase-like enzyme
MKNKQDSTEYTTVPGKPQTLKQFYQLMYFTRKVRQDIFELYLNKAVITKSLIKMLQLALERLQSIPRQQDRYELLLYENHSLLLDLSYEINELEKDIYFLTHPFARFYAYLGTLHPAFHEQVQSGLHFLKAQSVYNWITDRDGTINNYCGRYKSSIQSLYNALFLTRFAAHECKHRNVILTSAPLSEDGLLDVSLTHPSIFIYAGSKGRDFMDNRLVRHQYPVSPEKQARLNILNSWLRDLVAEPAYEIFSLIGSGLQYKFGETTIAYQDVSHSIPESLSAQFVERISAKVAQLDSDGKDFRIEKTGTDLEIVLTLENASQTNPSKEFDKGDGILFIDKTIDLALQSGVNLVCGDTAADLAMVEAVKQRAGAQTLAFFVTRDKELERRLRTLCPAACIVSSPDILVTSLFLLNNQEYN